jgi:hypothetical protein
MKTVLADDVSSGIQPPDTICNLYPEYQFLTFNICWRTSQSKINDVTTMCTGTLIFTLFQFVFASQQQING